MFRKDSVEDGVIVLWEGTEDVANAAVSLLLKWEGPHLVNCVVVSVSAFLEVDKAGECGKRDHFLD